jgi:hypothetical protein
MTLGCYTCRSGYVSLIVQYGKEVDLPAYKTLLSPLLQGNLTDEDLRVATRYSWDLGVEDESEGALLREAYWRQNYRRTKTDDPHRAALFLCTQCESFYCQRLSDVNKICPKCGKSAAELTEGSRH